MRTPHSCPPPAGYEAQLEALPEPLKTELLYGDWATTKEEEMREKELRETADCAICGKAHGHVGVPIFYRIRVRQYGVDLNRVRRQDGLTAMLGGHAGLAAVMGPDEEMAKVLGEAEQTVCGECIVKPYPLLMLFEKGD